MNRNQILSQIVGAKTRYRKATAARRIKNPSRAAPTLNTAQKVSAAKRKVRVDQAQTSRLKAARAANRPTTKSKAQTVMNTVATGRKATPQRRAKSAITVADIKKRLAKRQQSYL